MSDTANPSDAGSMQGRDRTKTGATRGRGESAEKSPNIFGRIALFLREVVGELKKVRYPTPEETKQYFLVVIAFVAVLMAFTGIVDLIFAKLNTVIFV